MACGKGWIGFNAATVTCFLEIRNRTFMSQRECLEGTPLLLGSRSLEVEWGPCFLLFCLLHSFTFSVSMCHCAIQKGRTSTQDAGLRVRSACESSHCHRGMCQPFCEVRTESQRLGVEVAASRCQSVLDRPEHRSSRSAL